MKPYECENERRVIEAVRSGRGDEDLERHVGHCESCGEAALAAQVLNGMRAADEAERRIPDAGLVWWKAQLLAKQDAGERATRPIRFAEQFACLCLALFAAGACYWQWPAIQAWLETLETKAMSLQVGSFWSGLQGFGLLAVVSVGIFLGFVAFAAYFALSEE